MKTKNSFFFLVILVVLISACGSNSTPSTIVSAGLFLDPAGTQPTEKYDARAIFYCVVTLDQPAPETVLKASWVAVETNRSAPNLVIKIEEIEPSSSTVVFELQNEGNFWPTGNYKVYLYINDKEALVIPFEVFHDYFPE